MNRGAVLVVSPYRGEYGPSRVLEHVLRALLEQGYRPVCAVPPGARLTPGLEALRVRVHVVPSLTTFPRTLNVRRLTRFFHGHLNAAHQLEHIARTEGARAVYSVSEAIFAAGLAARRAGVPSVTHAIGMSIGSPRWSARAYIGFLHRLTDRFVAVSSAVAEMFVANGVGEDDVTVVHNGIDAEEVESAARGQAPVDGAGPRIGMFAAYDPRKGHELFVEAAAELARAHSDARFYIVGGVLEDQPESVEFERRIERQIAALGLEGRVERPGYVAAPAVYDWMRAMDVIVAPSRTEAFAHALLEAMVCARPIVATAVEGNLDALVDGHSGLYVERTPAQLADAVARLLADPRAAKEMGAAAARRARAFFDLSATIPAIGQAVSQLLDPGAPSDVPPNPPTRRGGRRARTGCPRT
jgi:glycosyltransferase involved in cell wall biosynthesis